MSRDPIGRIGGINLYLFADNNSVKKIDRIGLFACTVEEHTGVTYSEYIQYNPPQTVYQDPFADVYSFAKARSWPACSDPCKKKMTFHLECKIRVVYPVASPKSDLMPRYAGQQSGTTYGEHENKHIATYQAEWVERFDEWSSHAGICFCSDCADAIDDFLEKSDNARGWISTGDNRQHDWDDYTDAARPAIQSSIQEANMYALQWIQLMQDAADKVAEKCP